MYNYNHLYYFYITAKSGGVTAAAKHLRISQPSLSSQLKVLEGVLDVRLFQKVGRKNILTPAATAIFGFCRQMFEISEEMSEQLSKKVPSASRRIYIGVSDEIDHRFVIEVVSLFLKKQGVLLRPKVTVVSGTQEQLTEKLRFRELDAVVTPLAMIDPDLENMNRAEVPVALTCSARWTMRAYKRNAEVSKVLRAIKGGESAQWLMPSSRFKLRADIDRFFEENELKGRIIFDSDVIASVVRSVVDGMGLAFLPLLYVAREIREKTIRVIGAESGYWKYRVWLSCHRQNKEDPLLKILSSSFEQICRKALG